MKGNLPLYGPFNSTCGILLLTVENQTGSFVEKSSCIIYEIIETEKFCREMIVNQCVQVNSL